ncbi:P-loop containing nucleoside triphosphate hydrolase protein [Terfezia claveryi]|nr:P-loop containing nucleoside triphosphate hydrolase protein [Terfezia claveryi]
MPRQRAPSNASTLSSKSGAEDQELGSMYDYLAKIILLGPSGCGKSCLLHRFVRGEWKVLTSQTIGVEFSSKIIRVGTGRNSKRIKLQLWDTAGQERFRSVTRSYYRGATGALLVYDVGRYETFAGLGTFLSDARALASQGLTVVLVGNKYHHHHPHHHPPRFVTGEESHRFASAAGIPMALEASAMTGENVDEAFERLARMIVTKIELGEVDPDDPNSGIQYGDFGMGYEESDGRRGTGRRGSGVVRVVGGGRKGACC